MQGICGASLSARKDVFEQLTYACNLRSVCRCWSIMSDSRSRVTFEPVMSRLRVARIHRDIAVTYYIIVEYIQYLSRAIDRRERD